LDAVGRLVGRRVYLLRLAALRLRVAAALSARARAALGVMDAAACEAMAERLRLDSLAVRASLSDWLTRCRSFAPIPCHLEAAAVVAAAVRSSAVLLAQRTAMAVLAALVRFDGRPGFRGRLRLGIGEL